MAHSVLAIRLEIVDLIKSTIRETMAPFGFRDATVRAGEDHDGDPVIFVDVEYDLTETPIDLAVSPVLLNKVQDRLWRAGEMRFAHIRHNFHERQPLNTRRSKRA